MHLTLHTEKAPSPVPTCRCIDVRTPMGLHRGIDTPPKTWGQPTQACTHVLWVMGTGTVWSGRTVCVLAVRQQTCFWRPCFLSGPRSFSGGPTALGLCCSRQHPGHCPWWRNLQRAGPAAPPPPARNLGLFPPD